MSEETKKDRKETPVFSGVLNYFPDAIKAVAKCSFIGNEQHNEGEPLHWDRTKSTDHLDALTRHLLDSRESAFDDDNITHLTKVAWRALAALQLECERLDLQHNYNNITNKFYKKCVRF